MKSLLLFLTMTITISCLSQKTTPPAAVQSAFTKNFPGTTAKKWDKEEGNYEANFTKDGKEMSAVFDANGKLKGAKIEEAAIVVKPNGEKIYEAEIKGKDLLFDVQGKFLKEEKD